MVLQSRALASDVLSGRTSRGGGGGGRVVRRRQSRALRAMVATEARKARRLAAALAATGKADASAHVKPTPAPPQAATTHAPAARPHPKSPRGPGGRQKTFVGVGSKAGGNYTPPAILRAVANAARNKEKGGGSGNDAASAPSEKADWACSACGASNFAKRRECFKCRAPKPGRKFTVAGMKGYEKRQQRREEKRREAAWAGSGKTSREGTTSPAKNADDAGGDSATPKKRAFAFADDEDEKTSAVKKGREGITASDKKRKTKHVKAGDKGKAPKRLRDPDSVLVYLEGWVAAAAEREEKGLAPDAPGFKPSNGWKLDKNIQNWLLHNAFDETQVDDVVFQTTLLYVGGLRGGPLERTREAAREKNVGKGVVAERARSILRALHDGKE